MQGQRTMVAEPLVEAREKYDVVSFLDEVRGTAEPSRQTLLDGLSAVMTGARSARQMYQQYSQQTSDPALKPKWESLGKEANVHLQIVERLITAFGGDPSYKSSIASDLEKCFGSMLQVGARGDAGDLVRLGNLVMLGRICQLQCEGMGNLARQVKDPATAKILRDASDILEREEAGHVSWNTVMYQNQFMKVMGGF